MKLNELISKSGESIADEKRCSLEVTKDLYGNKDPNYYEYELVEVMDGDDLRVELESLKDPQKSLCPDFFQ